MMTWLLIVAGVVVGSYRDADSCWQAAYATNDPYAYCVLDQET